MKWIRRLLYTLLSLYLLAMLAVFVMQRSLLFFPRHGNSAALGKEAGLTRWVENGQYIGMKRDPQPGGRIWLFAHGAGGQAAARSYMMSYFAPKDGVYVVEYPGYGDQPGKPTASGINSAVFKAYDLLKSRYGADRINALGESLGTGPISLLGTLPQPPRRIALLVPYDDIASVAQWRFRYLPIRLMMLDQWNNIKSLSQYKGRIDIWAAKNDRVIPVSHARNLAANLPQARYHEFDGGHRWARTRVVDFDD